MKMYTNSEQTAKLIELGFEMPKSYHDIEWDGTEAYDYQLDYSIGELLSFLPENIAKLDEMPSTLNISLLDGEWCVQYADFLGIDFEFCNTELVDALYDMIVKLKAEGVI